MSVSVQRESPWREMISMKIGGLIRTAHAMKRVIKRAAKGLQNVGNVVSSRTRVESLIVRIAGASPAGARPYSKWAGDES